MRVRVQVKGKEPLMFGNADEAYTYLKMLMQETDTKPLDFLYLVLSGTIKIKRMSR